LYPCYEKGCPLLATIIEEEAERMADAVAAAGRAHSAKAKTQESRRKMRATVAARRDHVRKQLEKSITNTLTADEVKTLARDGRCATRTIWRDIKAIRKGQPPLPRHKHAHVHRPRGDCDK